MSNNKQSSVEWLMEQITYDNGYAQRRISFTETEDLTSYFEQAKAMHKEQIIKSMGIAFNDMLEIQEGKKSPYKDWEQYYNETYGGGEL